MAKPSLFSSLPIVAALSKIDDVIQSPGSMTRWFPKGAGYDLQNDLYENWGKMRTLLRAYAKLDEDLDEPARRILTELAREASIINDFMARNGFPGVRLDDLGDPEALYLGAIYRDGGDHFFEGRNGYELLGQYKGFRMDAKAGVKLHYSQNREILEVPNAGGFSLYITRQETKVEKFRQLLLWEQLLKEMRPYGPVSAILPQWNFKQIDIDVSDLKGLWTPDLDGGKYYVAQAKMQADCFLNRRATYFRSGFAASVSRGIFNLSLEPEFDDFLVEWPLTFCYRRIGQDWPSATGYVPEYLFSTVDIESF